MDTKTYKNGNVGAALGLVLRTKFDGLPEEGAHVPTTVGVRDIIINHGCFFCFF